MTKTELIEKTENLKQDSFLAIIRFKYKEDKEITLTFKKKNAYVSAKQAISYLTHNKKVLFLTINELNTFIDVINNAVNTFATYELAYRKELFPLIYFEKEGENFKYFFYPKEQK